MIALNHNLMATNTANALVRHYSNLKTSTERLSSGLRINSAADDAAGLAIRELMRSDIAALNQGTRNANDAISMLQTFDGALGVIDEKLIRMKELAEQAATGTYDSTQRLMIDSEFQAMASEINRIARATDFNGIKLLDGNFGVGRTETIQFATATGVTAVIPTRSTVTINNNATNLTAAKYSKYLPTEPIGPVNTSQDVTLTFDSVKSTETENEVNQVNGPHFNYNINAFHRANYQPLTEEVHINYDNGAWTCTIMDGKGPDNGPTKIASTAITDSNGNAYIDFITADYIINLTAVSYNSQPLTAAEMGNLNQDKFDNTIGLTLINGNSNYTRTYELDHPVIKMSSSMGTATYASTDISTYVSTVTDTGTITANLGNGDRVVMDYAGDITEGDKITFRLNISGQADEKVVPIPDEDSRVKIHFGTMNDSAEDYYYISKRDATIKGLGLDGVDVKTQDNAQDALVKIKDAIVKKDEIRADYGALQNRFENTITNLRTQSENLQAAESRISDTDVAIEMTQFVRNQILTQSAVAMLAQANSMPQLVMMLIG